MRRDSHPIRVRAPALVAALGAVLLAGCTTYGPVRMTGEQSWIEARARAARAAAQGDTYRVRAGDTLGGIASRQGVPLASLAAANRIAPPYRIYAGQSLRIPGAAPATRPAAPTMPAAPVPVPHRPEPPVQVAALPTAGAAPLYRRPTPVRNPSAVAPAAAPTTAAAAPDPGSASVAEAPSLPAPVGRTASAAPVEPAPPVARQTLPVPQPATRAASAAPVKSVTRDTRVDEASAEMTRKAAITRPPSLSGDGFLWPVRGSVVSTFGEKPNRQRNDGINIAAPLGTPVRAAEFGVVVFAGDAISGFGNMLLIRHAGGFTSAYGHLDTMMVAVGDKVERGQVVATVGSSGDVRTPQLHFELRSGKDPLDPSRHLVDGETRMASAG